MPRSKGTVAATKKRDTKKSVASSARKARAPRINYRAKCQEIVEAKTAVELKLKEAERQRDDWRQTAKDARTEARLAQESETFFQVELRDHRETHSVHNLLFVIFTVTLMFAAIIGWIL